MAAAEKIQEVSQSSTVSEIETETTPHEEMPVSSNGNVEEKQDGAKDEEKEELKV